MEYYVLSLYSIYYLRLSVYSIWSIMFYLYRVLYLYTKSVSLYISKRVYITNLYPYIHLRYILVREYMCISKRVYTMSIYQRRRTSGPKTKNPH